MNSLFCLTAFKIKNKLLETLKKPLKLIVIVAFAALFIMNFTLPESIASGKRPICEFRAIVFLFYILCFISETSKGFYRGGTMFSMADVNLLFTAPFRSAAVLFHGMLSRLGSSVFMAFAFVYQLVLLKGVYGLSLADMLSAAGGYAAAVFISQLSAMLIYCVTCGDKNRIKRAKIIYYVFCLVFVSLFIIRLFSLPYITVTSAASVLTSMPMKLFPVAGWIFTAVEGAVNGNSAAILSGVLALVAFTAGTFAVLAFSKSGFFEDVLLSCEKNADRKADETVGVGVHTGKKQLRLKGRGASALFYMHLLENRRTKTSVLKPSSILNLALIGIYGLLFNGNFPVLFTFSCMASVAPVLSGKWLRELTMPYAFLIPDKAVKKLFFILPEMLPVLVAESVLHCALIGLICHLGLFAVLFMILARLSVSFVLTGSALVAARIFREKEKNNVFLTLCVLPGLIFTLPSVALCIGVLNFGFGMAAAFTAMAVVNSAVSAVLVFASRNILEISG